MPRKKLSRINSKDHYRVILTEVLPYEVPLRFSTLFFYSRLRALPLQNSTSPPNWTQKIVTPKKERSRGGYQPYIFSIQRGNDLSRRLSLMHPCGMLQFCSLYKRFGDNMASICKRSRWSLRAPIRIAKAYYDRSGVREEQQAIVDEVMTRELSGVECASEDPSISTSFFAYSPYSYLYKFFSSDDFFTLERRFQSYTALDVQSCFDSIYTHTISWAIKTKSIGKLDIDLKDSFDAQFDKAMQLVNHNETNGILIGPEVSRVFAEIILQAVDSSAERALAKLGLECGRDYAVRRYVDDYYIFHSSLDVRSAVADAITDGLNQFKLRFNAAKTRDFSRPFTTQLSRVKQDLSECIDSFMERIAATPVTMPRNKSNRRDLTARVQNIISASGVGYSECAVFILTCLRNKLSRIVGASNENAIDYALEGAFVETAFFLFSVSPHYQVGIVLSRLIVDLKRIAHRCGPVTVAKIRHLVSEEFHDLIQLMASSKNPPRFELANLFVAIESFGPVSTLPTKWIEQIWFADQQEIDYFVTVSLMHCFGTQPEYSALQTTLKQRVHDALIDNNVSFAKSDMFMLAMDSLSCPYFSRNEKRDIAKSVGKWIENGTISNNSADQLVSEASLSPWFFDWDRNRDVEFYLRKKSVSSAY